MRIATGVGYFFTLLLSATLAGAQDEGKKKAPDDKAKQTAKPVAEDKPKPADGPPEFDVSFSDNSNVKMVILDTMVVVATKYGKLTIPYTELRRVEFGFRYPDGLEAKIEAAIAKLGAPAFQEREDAEKELAGFKEYAVPSLKRATKNSDAELARRAEDVLKILTKKLPADRLNLKDLDTVETNDFTIRGRLETTTLKVKTKQFGETTLKIDEVKTLRATFVGAGSNEITLDAGMYAKLNYASWMDTKIDVLTDVPIGITATGEVDQWPQEPGRYLAKPEGGSGAAPGMPNQLGPPGVPNNNQGVRGMQAGFVRSGSVLGKIGANGAPFVVGSNYKQATSPTAGRLYLIIAPSSWGNNDCSGSYKVKVKVGE